MRHFTALRILAAASTFAAVAVAAKGDGYYGYQLSRRGDDDGESVIYETEGTTSGVAPLDEEPDVYLNASVSVGEISIEVQNLTAKVNLDAKVLGLLNFNAGVDASIDRVKLGIFDVKAKVELEARLGNVLKMVGNVLESIDLNPLIVTLGNGVADIVDDVGDVVGGSDAETEADAEALEKRDLTFRIENNILYSMHDFSGAKHTNRVLAQDGTLVDIFLNNQGGETGRRPVGNYLSKMSFTGSNNTVVEEDGDGNTVTLHELQYRYEPYAGLSAYCSIYVTPPGEEGGGNVVKTRIVAEAEGGGSATIATVDDE